MMKSLDAPHYDGHRTTWSPASDIINMMQDTLVALDWDGRTVLPYLAKSWEVSPDAKTYTFKLRDDVQFCSGKKFTSEDVVYSFKRLKNPETKAPYAWRAGDIKELRAPDASHRRVRANRALLRPPAAANDVHQRDPQQGQRRKARQGLRHQWHRRYGALVLRLVAAAHRDLAQEARRLPLGPVDVSEQGSCEVREAVDQDHPGGFKPSGGDDGRTIRRHPPDATAVPAAGAGSADASGAGGQTQLPAELLRLQDHPADGFRQTRPRGDEHRHQPGGHGERHHDGQRGASDHVRSSFGTRFCRSDRGHRQRGRRASQEAARRGRLEGRRRRHPRKGRGQARTEGLFRPGRLLPAHRRGDPRRSAQDRRRLEGAGLGFNDRAREDGRAGL